MTIWRGCLSGPNSNQYLFMTQIRKVDWWGVALIGLLVQAFWAARLRHPSYMDAYYYTTNGQRLAAGFGFTEEVIWQFLDAPVGVPAPSHTYWMPFPSLLAALGYGTADSFRGAQWPFWLLAGLLPLLAFAISQELSDERWQAWTAALFTAAGGFYAHWFSQPSTFAPFAWASGLGLYAMAQGSRGTSPHLQEQGRTVWWFVAGVMAGVAHLTRADGVLLLLVGGWVWLLARRRGGFQSLGLLVTGYLLVMGGWFIRNWQVLGRPLPTVGSQTIFLRDYNDLFAYGRSFDWAYFLDWGWTNILQSKLAGLSVAGQTFIAVSGLIFLLPFVLWAWLKLGRGEKRLFLRPFTWYILALYVTMSLVFTLPGSRGGLFHSSAAVWPWMMALAAAGIGIAVDWFAARLKHWQPARAKGLFSIIFVVIAFTLSFFIGLARADTDQLAQIYEMIGRQLPPDAGVMVGDAPGFYYHTGLTAVSIPNEPVETMLAAAARYQIGYLVLDPDHPAPLAPLYMDEVSNAQVILLNTYPLIDREGHTHPIKLYQLLPTFGNHPGGLNLEAHPGAQPSGGRVINRWD